MSGLCEAGYIIEVGRKIRTLVSHGAANTLLLSVPLSGSTFFMRSSSQKTVRSPLAKYSLSTLWSVAENLSALDTAP